MAPLPAVLDARYEILGTLGQGGMGAVYRALDRELGRPVALKTVDPGGLDDYMLDALRHEFRILSSLRHPHLVEVYDFGVHRPTADAKPVAYFTEELLEGQDLAAAFRGRPPAEWLPAVAQVCRALEFLHSRGYVHGDVKPANVLVSPSGSVKLVDLGLASEIRARGAGEVRGTLAYLAPECFRGGTVDGRADLYALGVILYELASGRPPFRCSSPRAWMKAHCLEAPPPFPPEAGLPPFLEHLVLRLLEKDPRARFYRANDVLERINRGLGARLPAETAATLEGRIWSVDWVGRRDVLTRLVETLLRVTAPREGAQPAEVLWIEGEPGMGKSRCLRELAWRAQLEGVTALRVGFRGVGHGVDLPLRRVCRHLARGLPSDGSPAPGWVSGYEEFLAVLDRPAGEDASDPERARSFMAGLAARAAADAPRALLLDDLDLAPEAALKDVLALVRAAASQSADGPCRWLVCATCGGAGPEGPGAGEAGARLLEALRRHPGAQTLALAPLTAAETEQLGLGVLGLERVPVEFAAWLQANSGGVPFWVEEALRAQVAQGRVSVGESIDRWVAPPAEASEAGEASRASALLEDIERGLSGDERAVAAALSVLARPAGRPLLQAVTGLDVPAVRAATEGLRSRGVLRAEGEGSDGGLWFTRGAVARRLYARIEPTRRAALHRNVAAAFERGGRPAWECALHLALAGAGEPPVAYWLVAAAGARGAGDVAAMETLLQHARAQTGRPEHIEACRPLAGLWIMLARIDEADALGREMAAGAAAIPGDAGEVLRAQGLEVQASCRARRGDIGGARALFAEAYGILAPLAERGVARAGRALERLAPFHAAACGETGEIAEARRLIERHLARKPAPDARAQYGYLRAQLLRREGDEEGAIAEMRAGIGTAAEIADPLTRESTLSAMRFGLGCALRDGGRLDEALEVLGAALDGFHRGGQTLPETTVLRELARLLLARGLVRTALERARRALRLAEQVGNPHAIATGLEMRAEVRAAQGEWAEAEDDLLAALAIGEKAADRRATADVLRTLGGLRLRMGRWVEARADLEKCAAFCEQVRDARVRQGVRVLEVLVALGFGDLGRARELLGQPCGEGGGAALAWAEAALSGGDAAGALARLGEARVEGDRRSDAAMALALRLCEARASLEAGRPAEARRALDAARAEGGELAAGAQGPLAELEARLHARAHRASAALAAWQEAAHFWERRRAPLRLAVAWGEAGAQAQALGDRVLARAYFDRALALWREAELAAPEADRPALHGLPAHVEVRRRAAESGSPAEVEAPDSGAAPIEEKTVVLQLESEEPEAEPAAPVLEDPEKDLLRAVVRIQRERTVDGIRRRLIDRALAAFRARRGLLFLDESHASGAAGPAMTVAGVHFALAEGEAVGGVPDSLAAALRVPEAERRVAAGDLVFLAPPDGPNQGVVVPLTGSSGRPLALLCLDWSGADAPVNLELLPFFASHAAAALESALRARELERDPETGLPSFPAIRLAMRDALERARKGQWPVSVVAVQVRALDRLRSTAAASPAGRWLRAVADTLRVCAADAGRDTRLGRGEGDVILAVLPNRDAAFAVAWERDAIARFLRGPRDGGPEGEPPELACAQVSFPADGETPDALWHAVRRRLA